MCSIFSCFKPPPESAGSADRHSSGHSHTDDISYHRLSSPNADFAFALYKSLKANTAAGKNIFYSPLGISSILSMVSAGAGGETHSQLFSTLGYSAFNQTQVNGAYKHLFDVHGHSQENLQLDVGNAAAVRSGFNPLETFLNDVKEFYSGEIFTVSQDLSEAAAKINRFIANKTQGKIKDMVKDLDPAMVMVLINYVYFKGLWENPFQSDMTRQAEFHVDKTTKVQVDMMSRTGHYKVYWDEANHATVISLPYKGDASMMIVLPDEDKMEEVEGYINKDHIRRWRNSVSMSYIDLFMPKFSISTDASLESTLKKMGIINAFGENADFSGISKDLPLKISKASHKAVLSVTEIGTEATAVSTMEITTHMLPPSIRIDRPFLVFIIENFSGSILFMGKINNPTAE
ncbi:alpha-1-antitrypsin homolog [Cheilinus undulatus]|uniref:alpha-1-antitrypsin homolog n=1 Tax=Cheilinus undulatus TaxID=241271 RepID=UPI001BD1C148|nr:alpha-1-antitrypsin homolog [Cheilinus undulatus]XP_041661935.1 alpha-1-antitrypsin homolog [Cheilinus undulatus]